MRIAFVGCGFVADYYMQSLGLHPRLELAAVTDHDPERLRTFCAWHHLECARPDLDSILADPSIGLVVNLTNPDSHYEVSKRCLAAGKHVYSEKPLAMDIAQAKELTTYASGHGLRIASAPCSILGESAQTLWKALREDVVGKVRVVYAEMDDGPVPLMPYRKWVSESGQPWPYKDEFEVGCTLEHAGYYVTWLTAFFGPAVSVTSFAAILYPDKIPGETLERLSPDYTVASIEFSSGVVARLTCGIMAPKDHRLRIVGDTGVLSIRDCWDYRSPVKVHRMMRIRRKLFMSPLAKRLPLVTTPGAKRLPRRFNRMHFARGVAELVEAIEQGRESQLSNDFCLHNNELVLAIQGVSRDAPTYRLTTSFTTVPAPVGERGADATA